MPGTLTIARKEFVDHVSDRTFLLCFAILLVVMTGTSFHIVQHVSLITTQPAWLFSFEMFFSSELSPQLASLGALLALALSVSSIQKERTEGSFKVLFSYPISRSKVIVGKLLAGIILISIVTVASMCISISILAYYMSIPITVDFLYRFGSVIAVAIILLTFFLFLGTAISTVVKSTMASLMILLVVIFLMSGNSLFLFVNILGGLFPGLISSGGYAYDVAYYPISTGGMAVIDRYAWISPIEAFNHFSRNLFKFIPGWGSQTMLTFEGQFYKNLNFLASPLIFTLAAFIVCLILFTRSDVT